MIPLCGDLSLVFPPQPVPASQKRLQNYEMTISKKFRNVIGSQITGSVFNFVPRNTCNRRQAHSGCHSLGEHSGLNIFGCYSLGGHKRQRRPSILHDAFIEHPLSARHASECGERSAEQKTQKISWARLLAQVIISPERSPAVSAAGRRRWVCWVEFPPSLHADLSPREVDGP